MNPFRDVRGGALRHRVNRRFLLRPILLVLVLIMLGGACCKQPAAVEIKGPILGMMTATGFDDKGQPQNPSFAFAPTEPQLVVIVQVGSLDTSTSQVGTSGASFLRLETVVAAAAADPVVNIAWYQTSDESEQKLFEHQVKVKSYERAYSIGKSKGTLKAGSYKVRATLAGQTQETELEVRPAKTETSSGASSQVSANQATAGGNGDDAGPGEPPVAGGSGTFPASSAASAEQSAEPGPGRCAITIPSWSISSERADKLNFCVVERCSNVTDYGGVNVFIYSRILYSNIRGGEEYSDREGSPPLDVGPYENPQQLGLIIGRFYVNPCLFRSEDASDLPGTKIGVTANNSRKNSSAFSQVSQTFTLGPDQDAPKVSVNSSPVKGTKVKAGDVIKIDATASERRTGGTWQTGVQRFQLVRKGPGGGIEELIQEVTDPSRLPKPCDQKSWSKVIEASYKVPNNPPPVIKLCAIAEDYAENESFKCGEFPTGDVWEGTLHTDVTNAGQYVTCTGNWDANIKIVAAEDGNVSGTASVFKASVNSCGTGPYAIVGSKWTITAVVNDAGFTFPLSQFIGGGMVQGSAFIQKSGRKQASGTATPSYSPGGGQTHSFVMTFDLKCKTCAP